MTAMLKKYLPVLLLIALGILFALGNFLAHAQANLQMRSPNLEKFEIALIGDLPYSGEDETKFSNLVASINQSPVAFVVHDGDIKSGIAVCSDEMFLQRKAMFQKFQHPFVLILGDNEWTDCHRLPAGGYDPIERLAKLRQIFYQGDRSMGQPTLRLTQQSENSQYSKFQENLRWVYGNVLFVGFNIPGSNNNFGRTPAMDAEYQERNAANLAWLHTAFVMAKRDRLDGIMLIMQANLNFELKPTNENRTGYNDFLAALEKEVLDYEKHVVLVHGDTHYFRMDMPLMNSVNNRRIENFTRVETFGTPDVHWVKAIIDKRDPDLFSFHAEIVPANLVN